MPLEKTTDKELLEELARRGFASRKIELPVNVSYKFPEEKEPFKLGIVSDTHFGSIHQRPTCLADFYERCKEAGVKAMLHCGDMVEGNGRLFRGQQFEMFLFGSDSMVDYVTKSYPKIPGVKTYIIGGSHDMSFYKDDGTDVLQRIADKRSDIVALGMSGAFLKFGRISIYLMHGSGGGSYARSYRLQKICEQFTPEQKPHLLFLGHYHTGSYLPAYRNIEAFQVPCFQSQTQYLREKGLNPVIGGIILTIVPDSKGMSHIIADWKIYYSPLERDY